MLPGKRLSKLSSKDSIPLIPSTTQILSSALVLEDDSEFSSNNSSYNNLILSNNSSNSNNNNTQIIESKMVQIEIKDSLSLGKSDSILSVSSNGSVNSDDYSDDFESSSINSLDISPIVAPQLVLPPPLQSSSRLTIDSNKIQPVRPTQPPPSNRRQSVILSSNNTPYKG